MHSGKGAIKDHFQQTHEIMVTRDTIVDSTKITRREAIKDHFQQTHEIMVTRDTIVDSTKITRREDDITRLQITEAVIILSDNPLINRQDTGITLTLKLFRYILCVTIYILISY